ncbi:MAG: hypothetical protein EBX52_09200, partial [Proteobacteria bacterium]|nr:hypothetical protein [Pseudomonadota bacterium]
MPSPIITNGPRSPPVKEAGVPLCFVASFQVIFIISCGAVRLAFLPLLFLFSIQSADAGICDSLARAFRKAEAIEASVGNVRKNLVATLFKPEELKTFIELGVPEKENIPAGKLSAAAEKGGKLG